MFIWGSYLFLPSLPEYTRKPAAIMFIAGSVLFQIACIALYYRLGAYLWKDRGLSLNSCMYLFANSTFILGSLLFYPSLPKPCELTGIWLFIAGSSVFFISPIYDISRAAEHFTEERKRTTTMRETLRETLAPTLTDGACDAASPSPPSVSDVGRDGVTLPNIDRETQVQLDLIVKDEKLNFITFLCTVIVCTLYISGSLLFVIGSVFFLPKFFSRDSVIAVNMFISGSVLFFLATMTTTVAKLVQKTARLFIWRRKEAGNLSSKDSVFPNVTDSGTQATTEEV